MRIAVAGGTGVVGQYVVKAIEASGGTPVVLARSTGVDLVDGFGLEPALEAVQAIIDVTNPKTGRGSAAEKFFVTAALRLQGAAQRTGVRHIVTLSIVGVDRVPGYGYYEAKLAHEKAALGGPVPATVLRSTQFHEFPSQVLQRALRGPIAVVPKMRIQPVAAQTVGEVLVSLAAAPATGLGQELAGPEVRELPDLARRLLDRRGKPAFVLPIRPMGELGKAMTGGALLPGSDAMILGPTFEEWLESAFESPA
ncbi:MAG: hypothetical protein QOG53_3396 [Frankiales bacterium]|jgi:uncharacterized protein YbjT (DUF2867 family)|nr:hypothetical protein [Frankiales bacterium]